MIHLSIHSLMQWLPEMSENDLYFYAVCKFRWCKEENFNNWFWIPRLDEHWGVQFCPWNIEIDKTILIIAKISSFYSENKYHITNIVDLAHTGIEIILEHFCACPNGHRTMGCCSHIIAMLCYATIGFRNQQAIPAANFNQLTS